jgi:hypothetical protein
MKILNKKKLFGGDIIQHSNIIQNNQIQIFFTILILGYFGIKIVYAAFFKYYPSKYYYRNVQITSNDENNSNAENITLNAYIPGIWNNEMSDFITMLVLGIIIYIFTNVSGKSIINEYGNLNIAFIFGYVIGLGYPPIYTKILDIYLKATKIESIKYIGLSMVVGLAIYIIISNVSYSHATRTHKITYLIYVAVLSMLVYGLYATRKISNNYSVVSYFNSNSDNCTFARNGVLRTSGDMLNITVPFLAFIIILLYSYEPSHITLVYPYVFTYGILLGIIVSGISFFGMEYFLQKQPEKECNNMEECIIKQMPEPVHNDINIPDINLSDIDLADIPDIPNVNLPNVNLQNIDMNIKKKTDNFFSKHKISIFNLILIIFLILVIIYLVYYKLSQV